MYGEFQKFLQRKLDDIRAAGLYKNERTITTPQRARIEANGKTVVNMQRKGRSGSVIRITILHSVPGIKPAES